jgi:hypothetical protein
MIHQISITKIQTIEDVKTFINQLTKFFGLGWHPDDDFNDYMIDDDTPLDKTEATRLNELMDKAFEICEDEDEIYRLAIESTKSIRHELGIGVDCEI